MFCTMIFAFFKIGGTLNVFGCYLIKIMLFVRYLMISLQS
ncbi:hypothetical protein MARI151_30061 [Maribacter litoralis]|uniref:Uncharacterized protein n=1 Tax=Maribacter litoralis TaxID=2059726 RepID=A0A653RR70_9FLAO|nr:hypothetical protein MARI151_30061 [Maribacter litoralis]